MHEKPTYSHESDVSRVNALLADRHSRKRAVRDLTRWAARLDRDPSFTLGGRARARLDGLERAAQEVPGKCGPEPLMAPRYVAKKRRRELGRPKARAPLAAFLEGPCAVPMPRPPTLRW